VGARGRAIPQSIPQSVSRESESRLDRAVDELVAALAEHVAATVDELRGEDPDRPLTVDEAASYLRIGRTAVYELLRAGELVGYRQGRRRLVSAGELRRYRARVAGELEIVRVEPEPEP
jgi:excisionase family DNA binding protein